MNNMDRVYSLIGLAYRAGKIVTGEAQIKQTVRKHKACLVIVSDDSSENTKKTYVNLCKFYGVKVIIAGEKQKFGHSIGKTIRAALAVIDKGFADSIAKKLELS